MPGRSIAGIAVALFSYSLASAQIDAENLSAFERSVIREHAFGGLPGVDDVYVRAGYVVGYNPRTRTPNWVAYHVEPGYRDTPSRRGSFGAFRVDPDIEGEPADAEFRGLFGSRGYARGHLAPYAVMGGDRDGDGKTAESDPDDARTVFEANYMSNVAPQHHEGFNGGKKTAGQFVPGLWYELERWIQDVLVLEERRDVWIFAGCIFGPGNHEKVGPNADIWVPPMFYKIVIYRDRDEVPPIVLAYLFPHQRVRHGELNAFLVSVDVLEALTGLDFLSDLDDLTEASIEDRDTWENLELR